VLEKFKIRNKRRSVPSNNVNRSATDTCEAINWSYELKHTHTPTHTEAYYNYVMRIWETTSGWQTEATKHSTPR